jgi:glycolate oxidase iron-sulfur subunit
VTLVEKPACCGALNLHIGRAAAARTQAKRLIVALERELDAGAEAVIVTSAGCGTTLKDYAHLFDAETEWVARARRVAARVYDFAEYLDATGFEPVANLPALPIAYHDACSLRHGQRVTAAPRRLLARAGFEVREVPEGHVCCGSAGSYNLLQPELAARFGARKAEALAATGAAAFVAGNLGCLAQLQRYSALAPMHTAELLVYASGGALPAALAGIDLGRYPPRASAAVAPATTDVINFWIYAPAATPA